MIDGLNPFVLATFLLVALTALAATLIAIKRLRLAREKESRARLLYEVSSKMLACRDEASIARYAIDYLKNGLNRSVALFTDLDRLRESSPYFRQAKDDLTEGFFASGRELEAVALAVAHGKQSGRGMDLGGWAFGHYYPVCCGGVVYGVLGTSSKNRALNAAEREFFTLIADQTAQALRMLAVTAQRQEAVVAAETEKVRSSFLRGISHDLRTPLTNMIGASATLLENWDALPQERQIQLIEGIQSDAGWLLRMVENVLSITRIQQNNMRITKSEELLEEVAGQAVALFRRRFPHANVAVHQTDQLLFAQMDALLIGQVFHNLLDNCLRHGGQDTSITITMREVTVKERRFAEIGVSDTGPGIRPEMLPHLFEMHTQRKEDASQYHLGALPQHEDAARGIGIGLSICKTIVEAHGGWIEGRNREEGGAWFAFALPL